MLLRCPLLREFLIVQVFPVEIIQSSIDVFDNNIQIPRVYLLKFGYKFVLDITLGSYHNQTWPICKCGRFDVCTCIGQLRQQSITRFSGRKR